MLEKYADWARKRMVKQLIHAGFYSVSYRPRVYGLNDTFEVAIQADLNDIKEKIELPETEQDYTDENNIRFRTYVLDNVRLTIVEKGLQN